MLVVDNVVISCSVLIFVNAYDRVLSLLYFLYLKALAGGG